MTASPPPWLTARHPEMLTVRADGSTIWPGGRQHYCPSSPIYREHAVRLVEKVASRYASHPATAIWHVGNEYGNVIPCHCDVSATAFRQWLRDRYGSVDALNDAWSTTFWSQRYGSFDEVLPPRSPAPFANPAQALDYARFTSDELLACYLAEKEVLDRITPDIPVTTNFPPSLRPADLWTWAPHVDVIGYDAYPDPYDPAAPAKVAFSYDVMRSLRGGRPWLLMEQAPGAVNWRARNAPKPPGATRLWSWQAVAHGADAVMFFQWRQSRGGAEKFHSAMVPHAGPSSRIFEEVRELGRELSATAVLAGARAPKADVAMVVDWPSWWALELDAHPSSDVRFLDAAWSLHRPLYEANVACDVVPTGADLSGYRLVVVPNLYMVTEDAGRAFERYVEDGGTLLVSFFSGIVDTCDRVHLGGYPAPFRRSLGLRVEEFHPLESDSTVGLSHGAGSVWSEEVRLEGAEAIEVFTVRRSDRPPGRDPAPLRAGQRVVPRHPPGRRHHAPPGRPDTRGGRRRAGPTRPARRRAGTGPPDRRRHPLHHAQPRGGPGRRPAAHSHARRTRRHRTGGHVRTPGSPRGGRTTPCLNRPRGRSGDGDQQAPTHSELMLLSRLYWEVLPCQFPTGHVAPSRLMFSHVQKRFPVLFHTEEIWSFRLKSRRSSEPVWKRAILPRPPVSAHAQNQPTGQSW